jgi:hypothetical protein
VEGRSTARGQSARITKEATELSKRSYRALNKHSLVKILITVHLCA